MKPIIKRFFDISFSFFTLLLFFWLIFLTWFLAMIDTRSNGIFTQERIGQFGKGFKIYKLRTIQIATNTGTLQISRIGRFLRNYKLDELPQLINVLKGEMSVVGPRPDIVGYYDLLEGENRKILELKPGLTSLASLKYYNEDELLEKQVSPLEYNDKIIFPDKVKLNLEYYYNQSFSGDLKVILATFKLMFYR
ncbi:lipopolysaccharide/colanic/teichoic acid biosynthesis glycosyltransferase [Flavobacterium sp. 103]|uniref:sugar transferase n=1 Tax=Flavobacterium sp. 103 TaxID=2135624 RepID=UPI000D5D5791|nr:lipopolysaccharide/colanic/teichoic acid biosynthesis glycosyltransferase [Flavobacterium sp. 103]